MSINQVSAQTVQTYADHHHSYWQQASEGVVIAQYAGNASQYGSAGLTRAGGVQPDEMTIFEIGSITKIFTAVLLAEAVRENLANFDDVVASHLPELEFQKDSPFNKITLTELSTHTSGLPREPADPDKGADRVDPPYADYNDQLLAKGLLSFRQSQLIQPGEHSYSNYGVGILGYVLTQIYGQPFRDLLKYKILNPLKMSSTDIPIRFATLPGHLRDHLATPHEAGEAVSHWELGSLAGAGAMISTAEDLIRFGTAHWNADTPVGLVASLAEVAKPRMDCQGLGWVIGGDSLKHGGGTGGFSSFLEVNPKDKTVHVFLSNSCGVSHEVKIDGNFKSIQGYWSGVLNTDTQRQPIVSYLDQNGRMGVFDQNYHPQISSRSSFIDDHFFFSFPGVQDIFKGKLQGELNSRELIGSITDKRGQANPITMQYSREMPGFFRIGLDETMQGDLARLSGDWWGYLGDKKRHFVYLKIATIGEVPVLRFCFPDVSDHSIPINSAKLINDKFEIGSDQPTFSFAGKLARDGKSIAGELKQKGTTRLTLRYSEDTNVRYVDFSR